MMHAIVEIVVKSYMPLKLEVGMLFLSNDITIWELKDLPEDVDLFYTENGAPIELSIIDNDKKEIATHEQIGLWDFGEEYDEYTFIETEELSVIFDVFKGIVKIELDPDTMLPVLFENKVVLSSAFDEEDDEDEEE